MRQGDGEWHAFFRLIRRVAKHEALVAGTNVVVVAVNVNALRNIDRLLLQRHQYITRLVVKAFRVVVVADFLDSTANDALIKG